MSARCLLAIAWFAMASAGACAQEPNMSSTPPQSRAEQSGFQETSRYADVRAFIDELVLATPRVRLEMFGRSEEGRELPLLVIGDPPADHRAAPGGPAVPTVFVMANIHAGEVEGKEAVLHLARRLTLGDLQPLLRSAVWLFAPIYNADGNENVSLENRSEQYGPVSGVGTRENARRLDLNRDFMKIESLEARALVSLFTRWDPDVVVDLHTTNGSYHGYHLTYAPALNPNTDPRITAFTRDRLLPAVRRAMTDRHEFRTYDYGNFAVAASLDEELEGFGPDDARKVWRTYDARPRFGNNYIGLRNRIAILSEAYSYLSFERRVRATEAFVEEIMRFVAANPADVSGLTRGADAAQARDVPAEAGVAFALRPLPAPVEVLVGAIDMMVNQRSGRPMRIMIESVATPTSMTVYDGFISTETRRVPAEYIVPVDPSGLHEIVERKLREHGILVERREASARRSVERFVVAQVRQAPQAFQGHRTTSVTGRFERQDVDIPGGSLVVRTNQPLGRLVFYLLEPESNDGLTTWNVLDAALKESAAHPVLKSVP
jgi:hypothetical protein